MNFVIGVELNRFAVAALKFAGSVFRWSPDSSVRVVSFLPQILTFSSVTP